MSLEVWRRVKGAALFAVSDHGRVQNLLSEEVMDLEPELDESTGELYLGIYLTDDHGGYFFVPVDILVVEAFLGPVDGLEAIIHRDKNPYNNAVWNLEVEDAYYCLADDCE